MSYIYLYLLLSTYNSLSKFEPQACQSNFQIISGNFFQSQISNLKFLIIKKKVLTSPAINIILLLCYFQ